MRTVMTPLAGRVGEIDDLPCSQYGAHARFETRSSQANHLPCLASGDDRQWPGWHAATHRAAPHGSLPAKIDGEISLSTYIMLIRNVQPGRRPRRADLHGDAEEQRPVVGDAPVGHDPNGFDAGVRLRGERSNAAAYGEQPLRWRNTPARNRMTTASRNATAGRNKTSPLLCRGRHRTSPMDRAHFRGRTVLL